MGLRETREKIFCICGIQDWFRRTLRDSKKVNVIKDTGWNQRVLRDAGNNLIFSRDTRFMPSRESPCTTQLLGRLCSVTVEWNCTKTRLALNLEPVQ